MRPGDAYRNRVLFLEDNQQDAQLLVLSLSEAGMNIIHRIVEEREQYARTIDEFQPDVVPSDYSLPTLDGSDAIHILKALRPDTPLIVVTGKIGYEMAAGIIRAGATDWLDKQDLSRLPEAECFVAAGPIIDIVITDVVLPDGSGAAFLQKPYDIQALYATVHDVLWKGESAERKIS